MKQTLVTDAGPLIALARLDQLGLPAATGLAPTLVPDTVFVELRLGSGRPGALRLEAAFERGDFQRVMVSPGPSFQSLASRLGPGEAAAIALAVERRAVLLLDERLGRKIAREMRVSVLGVGGLLLRALGQGIDVDVDASLSKLAEAGYRLSVHLKADLLARARSIAEGQGK